MLSLIRKITTPEFGTILGLMLIVSQQIGLKLDLMLRFILKLIFEVNYWFKSEFSIRLSFGLKLKYMLGLIQNVKSLTVATSHCCCHSSFEQCRPIMLVLSLSQQEVFCIKSLKIPVLLLIRPCGIGKISSTRSFDITDILKLWRCLSHEVSKIWQFDRKIMFYVLFHCLIVCMCCEGTKNPLRYMHNLSEWIFLPHRSTSFLCH